MLRRPGFIAAFLVFLGLAAATAPWALAPGSLDDSLRAEIGKAFNLDLKVAGRSVVAFLPTPRVKLEQVSLSRDGEPVVSGGTLRARFRLLPLFVGRLTLDEISLADPRIELTLGRGGFDAVANELRRRFAGTESSSVRLAITNGTLKVRDVRGEEALFSDLTVRGDWPAAGETMSLEASARLGGKPVSVAAHSLVPSLLVAGKTSPVAIDAALGTGRLRIEGETSIEGRPRLAGRLRFEARSLKEFQNFTGWTFPLGSLIQAVSFDSDFKADPDAVEWPRVKLALGDDRLEGALSARRNGGRLAITGTLDAEVIDLPGLAGFLRPPARNGMAGGWSPQPVRLADLTGADLDLRLSIGEARLGELPLQNVAANLFVTRDRLEVSLGRASIDGGTVNGRASTALGEGGLDSRVQGSFDKVALSTLFAAMGAPRWITADASGQFVLTGTGISPLEIASSLTGRVNAETKGGEFVGINLPELIRRFERRPLAASADWRGGKTSFDSAAVAIDVTNGVGEVTQAQAIAGPMRGNASGRIALIDRTMKLRVVFEPGEMAGSTTPPAVGFDLTGPWHDIAIAPDIEMLLRRSGAVRSLLGLDRRN